jgi:hypothetical protein
MRFTTIILVASAITLAACAGSSENGAGPSEAEVIAAKATPEAGTYQLESSERSGTLTVESANPGALTFSMFIVNSFGGHNMGILEQARATPVRGAWLHEDAAKDCRLELTVTDGGFMVNQTGGCSFGLGVLANGKYKKGPTLIGGQGSASESVSPNETSSSDDEPVTTTSGTCPSVVRVGMRGESFIEGIRKTVAIKAFVAQGETTHMETVSTNKETTVLRYSAKLRQDLATCEGTTATTTMFNELSHYTIRFGQGQVIVDVTIGASLVLGETSTFDNQPIFDVRERG